VGRRQHWGDIYIHDATHHHIAMIPNNVAMSYKTVLQDFARGIRDTASREQTLQHFVRF
jgi:hypothetical protein